MDTARADEAAARAALGAVTVLFEDNHLLVLNKPAGLLTQAARRGDDTLVERARGYLKARYGKPGNVYVGLVHRLDRNVSGVVVIARTSKAAARLTRAFAERDVDKRYLAIVRGEPPAAGDLLDHLVPRAESRGVRRACRGAPGAKEARLRFRRLALVRRSAGGWAVLELELLTGRKHQARAQLALAGFPLAGDPLYGQRAWAIPRPALHGWRVRLEHPVRREPIEFAAPIPADLQRLLGTLGVDWRSIAK